MQKIASNVQSLYFDADVKVNIKDPLFCDICIYDHIFIILYASLTIFLQFLAGKVFKIGSGFPTVKFS